LGQCQAYVTCEETTVSAGKDLVGDGAAGVADAEAGFNGLDIGH
jgi:hypothetical protein